MPAQSPNKVIVNFQQAVDGHTARFLATAQDVDRGEGGRGYTKLQLRRGLAVDYFFRVATDWQVFQDNWSVKAIAHKPLGFSSMHERKMAVELQDSPIPARLALFTDVQLSLPSLGASLQESRIRKILDAQGRNVEFATSARWKQWGVDHLDDPHKATLARVLSDDGVTSFLDLVRQLRNYIAHRSSASLGEIQGHAIGREGDKQVGLTGKDNDPIIIQRQNKIRDIGTYLDRGLGEPYGTPALFIAYRLKTIAGSLKWGA